MAEIRGGPEFLGWGPEMYRLTDLVDAVNQNTYAFICANSKNKPPRVDPVPRPGESKRNKKPGLFAAMARAAYRKGNK